ncbi:MAG: lysoplasmalogenase [Lachnospiraceae bacterium]|nr:lysoplasmalogenase [Lachnospiraceae bacterium]
MSVGILLLCVAGMILQGIFIVVEHKEKYVPAVILKGCASLVFVCVGYMGFRAASNASFAKMVFLGLCFGALGDILLNLRYLSKSHGQKIFLLGIAAFLTGHILYLVALIPLSSNLLISLIAGVIVAALLLLYIFKKLSVKLTFKIFGVFYIGAVVLMTAVAIGNLIAMPDTNRLMYALGAVLFTVSDIVLIFNTFGGTTKFSMRITNLSLYYIGQLLIALSLFYI